MDGRCDRFGTHSSRRWIITTIIIIYENRPQVGGAFVELGRRSLTSLSLPPLLAKFKVPSSGWCHSMFISSIGGDDEREREKENRKEGLYFTIALFPTPPLPSDGGLYSRWEADTLRRDTLQPLEPRILERKVFSTPSSPWRRRENGGQRRVGWGGRCHCTALGEGHYSEQGEPVTSAPTPGIDPYPPPPPPPPPRSACLTRGGCNAPYDSPLLLLGARVHRQRARGAGALPAFRGRGWCRSNDWFPFRSDRIRFSRKFVNIDILSWICWLK